MEGQLRCDIRCA